MIRGIINQNKELKTYSDYNSKKFKGEKRGNKGQKSLENNEKNIVRDK